VGDSKRIKGQYQAANEELFELISQSEKSIIIDAAMIINKRIYQLQLDLLKTRNPGRE
jgi:hypothetical protein